MRYFEENNNMKEILLILVINIISMFFAIKKSFNIEGVLLAFIFTNLITYFFVSAGTYYFIVDSDSKIIFVRNRFKPWKQINYNIKDVEALKIYSAVNIGNILSIKLINGNKKGYSCNLSKNELEELIQYVHEIRTNSVL